ncbi:MAG: N-acetylmuramoyl-L-alanine amidase [Candidatus Acidiferrum sp.]
MFLDYFELREQPFAGPVDPAHSYRSRSYRQALSSLTEAVLGNRGNLLLLAAPGLGLTTLLEQILQSARTADRTVKLFQKSCTSREILKYLLTELGADTAILEPAAMYKKLNGIWFAEMLAGKRFILFFEDAHELDDLALHTLQVLSRFETSHTKFLQLVLCGQPKLLSRLDNQDFTQLRKRFAAITRLNRFTPSETADYIHYQLQAAGHQGKPLFDPQAIALIAARSEGIPANIDSFCSRALLEAYDLGLSVVSTDIIDKVERNLAAITADTAETAAPAAKKSKAQKTPAQLIAAQLTYLLPRRLSFSGSLAWAASIAFVLLSAGLALPHGMLKGMTQIMAPRDSKVFAAQTQLPPPPVLTSDRPAVNLQVEPATTLTTPTSSLSADTATHKIAAATPSTDSRLSLTRELGLKINRIVIDPGHGGFDTGAKGPHGLLEKDVCLDVALRLGQMIEENMPGAQVVYTRKDDSYVPLEERTAIANNSGADLFISIHANSSDIRDVRGVETYYLSLATSKEAKELAIRENALTQSSLHDLPDLVKKITNNEKIAESKLLAAEIQGTLSQRLQLVSQREKNRGVKQAPFIVLAGANMPAVLSEISFVSNANDESLLLESGQRQRIADGLYRGIAAYLDGLQSVPPDKQKLVTDDRINVLSRLTPAMSEAGRNPL